MLPLVFTLAALIMPEMPPFVPADYAMSGAVLNISDGDSITVMTGESPTIVDLAGIDAPDTGQPYFEDAKNALDALCAGRYAALYTPMRDTQGRAVAYVLCGGTNASAHQVQAGMARLNAGVRDAELQALEREARSARRGLWAHEHPDDR